MSRSTVSQPALPTRSPPDITWTDATGAIHQGGRPSCVPYDHPVHVQSMEAVMYPIETGGSMGTIVWVKC